MRPVVGITPTADHRGYWLVASDGGTFAFGDARFHGSIPGLGLHPAGSGLAHSLSAPVVGIVPSADGGGYLMVGADGGVFAFGDARFEGSCTTIGGCVGTAVSVIPDSTGKGYWVVTSVGAVYSFGDARYYGAPGKLGVPVTSAAATPDGKGYRILFGNGEVFSYGDAANSGSPSSANFNGLDRASVIFRPRTGRDTGSPRLSGSSSPWGTRRMTVTLRPCTSMRRSSLATVTRENFVGPLHPQQHWVHSVAHCPCVVASPFDRGS